MTSGVFTLAELERLKAQLKPMKFPFLEKDELGVLVVATDEQIAEMERKGILQPVIKSREP